MVRQAVACVLLGGVACAGTPIVKLSCTITWERSADYWRVDEYRVVVWKSSGGAGSERVTTPIKAPRTEVSCHDAGARSDGVWQATIQACLKDGACSDPGKPKAFKIAGH